MPINHKTKTEVASPSMGTGGDTDCTAIKAQATWPPAWAASEIRPAGAQSAGTH
jgi:hypothetical protein